MLLVVQKLIATDSTIKEGVTKIVQVLVRMVKKLQHLQMVVERLA